MPRSCCNRQLGLGNGDSIPSPGDTIFMGRYPTDYSMTDFKDWLVDSHAIGTVADVRADLDYLRVDLLTESGYPLYMVVGSSAGGTA